MNTNTTPKTIILNAFAYPDSGTINGVDDPENPTPENPAKRPFLVPSNRFEGDWRWQPEIEVETGTILNWPKGMVARIYDKPCDDCNIFVDGENLNDGEYVPKFLSPGGEGFGDYIIMDIDGNGKINKWNYKSFLSWYKKAKPSN